MKLFQESLKLFSAEIDFTYNEGYPPTVNNKNAYKKLVRSAQKIVGKGCGFRTYLWEEKISVITQKKYLVVFSL